MSFESRETVGVGSKNDIDLKIVEKRSVFSRKRAFMEQEQLNDAGQRTHKTRRRKADAVN